ncbi:MAG: sigma-54 dependent transcriptional regulator [Melioribacteraceae bacterium]
MKERLLIIDDSIPFLRDIELLLQKKYQIRTAINGKMGLDLLRNESFTAVLLDIKMAGISGLQVLEQLKTEKINPPPIIIVSDSAEIATVVKAIKLGASDYIQKDFNLEILYQKINNAIEKKELQKKIETLNNLLEEQLSKFVFESKVMQNIDLDITRLANLNCNILLKGETGVGKDLIAFEIFRRSTALNNVFVTLPLSTISEQLLESELFGFEKGSFTGADKSSKGKIEAANDGTLYLPEISSLSENIQLKLLQFMQYKTITKVGNSNPINNELDIRIIFATNENLEQKVKENKMRPDFYYRIDSVVINIPPLRERKEDIKTLAEYFTFKHSRKLLNRQIDVSNNLIARFQDYSWPGNVRQLENTILKTLVRLNEDEDTLNCSHLPAEFLSMNIEASDGSDTDYNVAKRKFKVSYFQNILKQADNNYTKAAEIAGISRNGLDKALKELGLK